MSAGTPPVYAGGVTTRLLLPDPETVLDVKVMLERARRIEAEAAVRLQAVQTTLVLTSAALARPMTLAVRAVALGAPAEVDVVVSASAVLDRVARLAANPLAPRELEIPPVQVRAPWAGTTPPRSGWKLQGEIPVGQVRRSAADGVAAVASGVPAGAGGAAVTALRERVWGRPLSQEVTAPASLAFAAESMGFLGPDDTELARLFTAGPWTRLALARGQCLTRRPLLG